MNKFKVAFEGLFRGLKDPSILIQFVLGFIAIGVSIYLKMPSIEFMIILICVGLVIGAEYFNTAIERLADIVAPTYDKRIKYIKDLSAAAVLIQAIVALVIMVLIVSHLLGGAS